MSAPVTTDKPAHAPLTANAERRTWEEFRQAGMLTVANTVLHWFGWQITVTVDTDTSMVVDVYPERTKYRGHQRELYESGMERLTDWLVNAAPSLREDIRDE